MAREILVNVEHQEKRVVIVNDGRIEEFYIERPGDKTIVGNIYKGTIEAALASINGAFVEMGMPKKGFLYLTEIESGYEFEDAGSGASAASASAASAAAPRRAQQNWRAGSRRARRFWSRSLKSRSAQKGRDFHAISVFRAATWLLCLLRIRSEFRAASKMWKSASGFARYWLTRSCPKISDLSCAPSQSANRKPSWSAMPSF